MPYFKWHGIDLSGKIQSGSVMARSAEELSSFLFKENIALLECHLKKPLPFFHSISLSLKIGFFKQLSLLLQSGIFLDQALQLVLHQIKNRYFKTVVQDILLDIQHGISLSKAFKNYPAVFDDLTITMVETGQESGGLHDALGQLCIHQEVVLDFRKKLRSVLLMPAITFLFFIAITLVIFVVIVPTFGAMLMAAGHPIAQNTHYIIMLSDFIRSWYFVMVLMVLSSATLLGKHYFLSHARVKKTLEFCLLKLPLARTLVQDSTYAYFFQSLALLTKSGVHLVTALSIACQSIGNSILRNKMECLLEAVKQGNSLSQAVQQQPYLFSDHIQALLAVGQESACLPFIFSQIATLYKEHIDRFLTTLATLAQPLLMIILGLLITGLVFSVYVPLFNLSSVIA